MDQKLAILLDKLKDDRSKLILFVSHCLLNENARYLGGAFRKGVVDELVEIIQARGIGIVQIECPEQRAWGGVLKPYLWKVVGLKASFLYLFRKSLFSIFIARTRHVYAKIAKETAKKMKQYRDAGFNVIGFIGIDGSPTCGVGTTLDLRRYDLLASLDPSQMNRSSFNEFLYSQMLVKGKGLFAEILEKELHKQKVSVPFFAHDLVLEMKGEKQELL
nr:2-thiouracil desulfurase family protein [Candidatus Sigynarchaeota archaeon]